MHDDRSPGRGYPLPHPENLLVVDADRLRESVLAIDTDYRTLVQRYEAFKNEADKCLEQIDAGMAAVRLEQSEFHDAAAEKLASMKEEIGDAIRILNGRIAEVEEGAASLFQGLGSQYEELAEDLRERAEGEIRRFDNRIPNFGNMTGEPYTAGSSLPAGTAGRLEYIEGLGFFRFVSDADDPADGETCVMPEDGRGRWIIALPCFESLLDMCGKTARRVVRSLFLTLAHKFVWGSIASASSATRTVPFSGALVGDTVILVPPSAFPSGISCSGRIPENGTVSVTCHNATSAALTPPEGVFKIVVLKEGLI